MLTVQVFELFSELVVCTSGMNGALARNHQQLGQELQAFLHKQISSSDAKTQRVGIIGTARLVRLHEPMVTLSILQSTGAQVCILLIILHREETWEACMLCLS